MMGDVFLLTVETVCTGGREGARTRPWGHPTGGPAAAEKPQMKGRTVRSHPLLMAEVSYHLTAFLQFIQNNFIKGNDGSRSHK